jgi:curli biogenesis system outer membrane secretion channel CsgG
MMKRLAVASLFLALSCLGALAQTVAATTNGSVAITTGNTFQTVLTAVTTNAQRRSLTIQNNNASDSCWLFIGTGSATKGTAILLASGQAYTRYYPYIPTDAIQATCATTADTLYIDNQ